MLNRDLSFSRNTIGMFGGGFPKGLLQSGIFRTNCIDCLDRTNVGMFIYAKISAYRQLRALGIDMTQAGLSNLLAMMTGIWAEHGDTIANQYAGSGAMHRVEAQGGTGPDAEHEIKVVGGVGNALVAAKRYYSNVSRDFDRQQSMDLLLGIFVPKMNQNHIWEMKEVLEDKRTTGRRASDAVSMLSVERETTTSPEERKWRETAFKSVYERTAKCQMVCSVDLRPKCKFYDDLDQPSLSLTRLEDQLVNNTSVFECDIIGADNLTSKPYTACIKESGINLRERYKSYIPGYVEQDLYFGRKEGTTHQEHLYAQYCRLDNIPLYSPSSSIFDINTAISTQLEQIIQSSRRGSRLNQTFTVDFLA